MTDTDDPTTTFTDSEPTTDDPTTPEPLKRRYQENTSFYSDLFKLKVSSMLQWKGWRKMTQNAPYDEHHNLNEDWFHTEHCHYFHTIDSNGKVQEYCQPVGQHVHKIEVIRKGDEIYSVKCVSGPLKWQITTKFGKRQKILMPDPHDTHTHEMEYCKSNKIMKADVNSEAVKVIGRAESAASSTEVYDEHGKPLGKLQVKAAAR